MSLRITPPPIKPTPASTPSITLLNSESGIPSKRATMTTMERVPMAMESKIKMTMEGMVITTLVTAMSASSTQPPR